LCGVLTKFVIEAVALNGCALPWFPGHETRAGFLAAVRRVDGGLAEALHSGVEAGVRGRRSVMSLKALRMVSGVRWVRVEDSGRSPLKFGLGSRMGFKALIEPGSRGWFSVTILNDDLAKRAATSIPQLMGSELTIGPCRLKPTSLSIEVIDTESLWKESTSNWESIEVYFQTPTYLNPLRGDMRYKLLYPEINALLGNLIAMAKHITGKEYPKPEEVASKTYISGIDIKTPKTKSKTEAPTGFIGWIKIKPKNNAEPETKKLITHLLKLAEKTNIGGNRSAGYGEVKIRINHTKSTTQ